MRQLLFNDLKRIKDLNVTQDVCLGSHTTFKIGGRARLFLTPLSTQALEKSLGLLKQAETPYRILGNGSNLLITDRGVDAVINLSRMSSVRSCNGALTVQAGMTISGLLRWCLDHGYGGLEALAGIPGSLGGAISMNAGACGCEIADFVEEILLTCHEGSAWFKPVDQTFSYRKSSIPAGSMISALKIRLSKNIPQGPKKQALFPRARKDSVEKIRKVMQKRLISQPLGQPSAGCVFKNPEGAYAWRLIAESGLQGFANGDAQVSRKHANFIVNRGKADFIQVKDLMAIIKERVYEQTGTLLKEELVIWEDDIIH